MMSAIQVAVIGPGGEIDSELQDMARTAGRLLAEGGAVVLTGGESGVMEAAVEGAALVPGSVRVGILPDAEGADANEFLSARVLTDMGQARNFVLIRSANAVLCIGGSLGTMSEVFLAARLGLPIVRFRSWSVRTFEGEEVDVGWSADTIEDAVTVVLAKAAPGAE